jgi:hypothetical protein
MRYPSPGGLSVYFKDITSRRLALDALRESERRLAEQAALLDKANDAIFVRRSQSQTPGRASRLRT